MLKTSRQERVVLKSDLETFFENYKKAVDDHNIKAKYIWNCDETMLDGWKSQKKIVCANGGARSVVLKQKMTEHVTLLLFVSAAGDLMKPLVIFPLKTLPELAQSVYDDFNISGQENGWIDGAIFRNYIQNFFVDDIVKRRANNGEEDEPALLVMDHHTSRDALDVKLLWTPIKSCLF